MKTKKNFMPVYAFHPGITLREKLEEMGMSVKEFALRTTKPEKTINAVLNGSSAVTPDMSVAFEQITMIPAHLWLNLQRNYDEYVARQKREEICKDPNTIEWARLFPYTAMAKLGWVSETRVMEEKIMNLFSFFKITSVKAWEDYYLKQELKSAFKLSLAHTKYPYSISAWLRQGELLAKKTVIKNAYSEALLREKLPLMILIMKNESASPMELIDCCSESGVKLVYIDHIPHAPVNGCARWIGETPSIQITKGGSELSAFWFTFFHEVGHILLHGKKDVFLEDKAYFSQQSEKEAEADAFAQRILASSDR